MMDVIIHAGNKVGGNLSHKSLLNSEKMREWYELLNTTYAIVIVQIMACRLACRSKQLSEPMPEYC